uniref:Uncharacterized protein n=1 Tax=Sphaerodactylus townsendi TaxID=933632 RepID=A0ACB8EZ37_9SAUR
MFAPSRNNWKKLKRLEPKMQVDALLGTRSSRLLKRIFHMDRTWNSLRPPLRAFDRHQGAYQGGPSQATSTRPSQMALKNVATSEAIEKHKKYLADWFRQQPNEERQFGPSFSLDTTHVDPVIRESSLEEILKPSPEMTIHNQLQAPTAHQHPFRSWALADMGRYSWPAK